MTKEYRGADLKDSDKVFQIVQEAIKAVYPQYYPMEIVDFFCELHSKERILEDIRLGQVRVLLIDGCMAGTGSCKENCISRVYVLPRFQHQGFGQYMMSCMEKELRDNYDTIYLEASRPAKGLYEYLGYKVVKEESLMVKEDVVFSWEVMEKQLWLSGVNLVKTGEEKEKQIIVKL